MTREVQGAMSTTGDPREKASWNAHLEEVLLRGFKKIRNQAVKQSVQPGGKSWGAQKFRSQHFQDPGK